MPGIVLDPGDMGVVLRFPMTVVVVLKLVT